MTKVLVSFDDRLLRRLDLAAGRRGLSRSAYLAQIAERALGDGTGPGNSPQAHAALAALDLVFAAVPAIDTTAAIRAERDAH